MNLRDQGEQGPTAACFFSPWTDLAVTGASLTANRDLDPMQVADCLACSAAAYLGEADPRTPLASPIYGDFVGLPPLLIFVGDTEILLDDSRRLLERARLAGVAADLRLYPDMPHAWPLLNMIMPEGGQALDEATAFLQASALRAAAGLGAEPLGRIAAQAEGPRGSTRLISRQRPARVSAAPACSGSPFHFQPMRARPPDR